MVIPHVRFQQLVHLHTTNQNQVMRRPGLPEIPQPGTQEYREYFEKYGHIINQLWDDDSYSDTEYIPIRFTSDLGKLDYVKLYDIYDGPISYIDDPRDYFYSGQGRGLVYYSIDSPELFNVDSENLIDSKYIIADFGTTNTHTETISTWFDIPSSEYQDVATLFLPKDTEIRFVPAANFSGEPGNLTTKMVDGYGKLSSEQIKLSTKVNPVNDPLITSFHSINAYGKNDTPSQDGVHNFGIEESFYGRGTRHTASEEAPYTITGHALVNELIADADGLTREEKFSIQENHNPNNGTATIDPKSGSWTYTPDELFTGNDNFMITITDDEGFQETREVKLEISPPASISGDLSGVGYEDTRFDKHSSYTITGWIDFENTTGIKSAQRSYWYGGGLPYRGNATIRYNDQGVFWAYEAPKNYNGIEDISIEIEDKSGNKFYYLVPLRILPTNDKGEFTGDLFGEGSVEGGTIRGDLSFSDAIDGDSNPNYQIKENGSNGTAEIDPETGSWTYDPGDWGSGLLYSLSN